MEAKTSDALVKYLKGTSFEASSVSELSGGNVNFVWRIQTADRRTIIAKHAEDYCRFDAGIALPASRMDFEARALELFHAKLPPDDTIHVPEIYKYDADARIILMSDGGDQTLKAAYEGMEGTKIRHQGARTGVWLADFHRLAKEMEMGDHELGRSIYRYAYRSVAGALEKNGLDASLGERANEEYGSLLQTDNEHLCHGDFWPGNFLVGPSGLTIVDWEIVRRGCGATDVAQFAAEAYLLDRFKGGKGLMTSFLEAYMAAAKVDRRFAQRVAVHFGVHLAFWPTFVAWTDEAGTKEVVRVGSEYMARGMDGDWEWLAQSLLKNIIPSS